MYNIAVIGGGVIGITTALQLQNDIKNSRVVVFAEKLSPNTTGDVSAGFWTPYLLEGTSDTDITKWSKVTHDKLQELWKNGDAVKAGICLLPALRVFTDKNINIPNWSKVPFGSFMLSHEQVDKLSKQQNKKYTGASHYVTFTAEPVKLLPFLMQQFLNNGGQIINKKIKHFEELVDFDVVLNCTGLEARQLTGDNDIHAIRGQISRVKAPWQFQIISDESDDGCYIIPNTHYVILGGTHQVKNENLSVCPKDKQKILTGCAKMSPGLQVCDEHLDAVGLRPGRNTVRIEAETVNLGNKTLKVVHNYGHGGAGVTLAFGCAIDASKLAQNALNINLKSHL